VRAQTVRGHEASAVGEVTHDRIGFEQDAAIVEFNRGNSAVGKPGQELGGPRCALEDLKLYALESNTKLSKQQSDFVAVAGGQVIVHS
jgi:hypothetical protein